MKNFSSAFCVHRICKVSVFMSCGSSAGMLKSFEAWWIIKSTVCWGSEVMTIYYQAFQRDAALERFWCDIEVRWLGIAGQSIFFEVITIYDAVFSVKNVTKQFFEVRTFSWIIRSPGCHILKLWWIIMQFSMFGTIQNSFLRLRFSPGLPVLLFIQMLSLWQPYCSSSVRNIFNCLFKVRNISCFQIFWVMTIYDAVFLQQYIF